MQNEHAIKYCQGFSFETKFWEKIYFDQPSLLKFWILPAIKSQTRNSECCKAVIGDRLGRVVAVE